MRQDQPWLSAVLLPVFRHTVRVVDSSADTRRYKASREVTLEQAAHKVKDVAKTIRARETVWKFRESGAITELVEAVHEAAVATRDSAKEVSNTAKEIRDSHLAANSASAIEDPAEAADEQCLRLK